MTSCGRCSRIPELDDGQERIIVQVPDVQKYILQFPQLDGNVSDVDDDEDDDKSANEAGSKETESETPNAMPSVGPTDPVNQQECVPDQKDSDNQRPNETTSASADSCDADDVSAVAEVGGSDQVPASVAPSSPHGKDASDGSVQFCSISTDECSTGTNAGVISEPVVPSSSGSQDVSSEPVDCPSETEPQATEPELVAVSAAAAIEQSRDSSEPLPDQNLESGKGETDISASNFPDPEPPTEPETGMALLDVSPPSSNQVQTESCTDLVQASPDELQQPQQLCQLASVEAVPVAADCVKPHSEKGLLVEHHSDAAPVQVSPSDADVLGSLPGDGSETAAVVLSPEPELVVAEHFPTATPEVEPEAEAESPSTMAATTAIDNSCQPLVEGEETVVDQSANVPVPTEAPPTPPSAPSPPPIEPPPSSNVASTQEAEQPTVEEKPDTEPLPSTDLESVEPCGGDQEEVELSAAPVSPAQPPTDQPIVPNPPEYLSEQSFPSSVEASVSSVQLQPVEVSESIPSEVVESDKPSAELTVADVPEVLVGSKLEVGDQGGLQLVAAEASLEQAQGRSTPSSSSGETVAELSKEFPESLSAQSIEPVVSEERRRLPNEPVPGGHEDVGEVLQDPVVDNPAGAEESKTGNLIAFQHPQQQPELVPGPMVSAQDEAPDVDSVTALELLPAVQQLSEESLPAVLPVPEEQLPAVQVSEETLPAIQQLPEEPLPAVLPISEEQLPASPAIPGEKLPADHPVPEEQSPTVQLAPEELLPAVQPVPEEQLPTVQPTCIDQIPAVLPVPEEHFQTDHPIPAEHFPSIEPTSCELSPADPPVTSEQFPADQPAFREELPDDQPAASAQLPADPSIPAEDTGNAVSEKPDTSSESNLPAMESQEAGQTGEPEQGNDSVTSADIDFLLGVDSKVTTTADVATNASGTTDVVNVAPTDNIVDHLLLSESTTTTTTTEVSSAVLDHLLFAEASTSATTTTIVGAPNLITEDAATEKFSSPTPTLPEDLLPNKCVPTLDDADLTTSNASQNAGQIPVTSNDVTPQVCDSSNPAGPVKASLDTRQVSTPGFGPGTPKVNNLPLQQQQPQQQQPQLQQTLLPQVQQTEQQQPVQQQPVQQPQVLQSQQQQQLPQPIQQQQSSQQQLQHLQQQPLQQQLPQQLLQQQQLQEQPLQQQQLQQQELQQTLQPQLPQQPLHQQQLPQQPLQQQELQQTLQQQLPQQPLQQELQQQTLQQQPLQLQQPQAQPLQQQQPQQLQQSQAQQVQQQFVVPKPDGVAPHVENQLQTKKRHKVIEQFIFFLF